MTLLKRRSHMVSFRLSEEEYEGLKHICIAVGARSLSDVARDAVQRLLESGSSPRKDLNAEFELLSKRMEVLDREVGTSQPTGFNFEHRLDAGRTSATRQ